MAENSKIEWTTHTFNPWRGCTRVSEACRHCYAETMAGRNPKTLGTWGPNGTRVVAVDSYWRKPIKWNTDAALEWHHWRSGGGEGRVDMPRPELPRVFCASMADVFEEWSGHVRDVQDRVLYKGALGGWMTNGPSPHSRLLKLDDVRERLFKLIDETQHLDWLLLTKRPENIERMLPEYVASLNIPYGDAGYGRVMTIHGAVRRNVWLGTTVEDQKAKVRIDHLRHIPAAVRFLSIEPLLEDLGTLDLDGIHWVIVGGESGHHARPLHPDWARSIRDQCQAAGVAFHFKQWGEWEPSVNFPSQFEGVSDRTPTKMLAFDGHVGYSQDDMRGHPRPGLVVKAGKKRAGRVLDGRTWDELPKAQVLA